MRKNLRLLLNGAEGLMQKDVENAKALSALFALVFTGKVCLQETQIPGEHVRKPGPMQVPGS